MKGKQIILGIATVLIACFAISCGNQSTPENTPTEVAEKMVLNSGL